MPRYEIRVTRNLDGEYVDIDIEEESWEAAKASAISEAKANSETYFPVLPEPEFGVEPMDDDESSHILE